MKIPLINPDLQELIIKKARKYLLETQKIIDQISKIQLFSDIFTCGDSTVRSLVKQRSMLIDAAVQGYLTRD